MKFVAIGLVAALSAFAQRPSNPALLIPQEAPVLDYAAVENPLGLSPDGKTLPNGDPLGAPAATAFDSHGHMFLLSRGPKAFFEFDQNLKLVRSFGEGLFTRTHGLKIDSEDNLWVTDVTKNIVVKFNPKGEMLMTLGTAGPAGEWSEPDSHKFNEPNDIAIGRNGDIFVVQGHTPGMTRGDARVLKFDKNGKFIKSWGGKGTEPGKFDVAHGIAIDAKGLLWVTDRENQRIQIFDQDGNYQKEVKFAGLPCALVIGPQNIFMVNGFAGQLLKLDLNGKVLAAVGKPGKGVGEFGEAHQVTVGPKGDIWVSDTVNSSAQRFVKK
jgi:streptogramin lyase